MKIFVPCVFGMLLGIVDCSDTGNEPITCGRITCSGHGKCELQEGWPICICEKEYQGIDCENCAEGFHRDDSNQCVENGPCTLKDCGAHGFCKIINEKGYCFCNPGYAGEQCAQCADAYQGENCDQCKPGYYRYPPEAGSCVADPCKLENCSSRGLCDNSTGKAVCQCGERYAGEHCENCAEGYSGEDCLEHWLGSRCGFSPECNLEEANLWCNQNEPENMSCWQKWMSECANSMCASNLCHTFAVGGYVNFSQSFCTKPCATDADCQGGTGAWGTQWKCLYMGMDGIQEIHLCMPTAETDNNSNGKIVWKKCNSDFDCLADDHSCQIEVPEYPETQDVALVCKHKNFGNSVSVGLLAEYEAAGNYYLRDCENGFGSAIPSIDHSCVKVCQCQTQEDQTICDARECAGLLDWTCGAWSIFHQPVNICHPKLDCLKANNQCSEAQYCDADFNRAINDPRFLYWCAPKSDKTPQAKVGEPCAEDAAAAIVAYCENRGWCLANGVCTKTCSASSDCEPLGNAGMHGACQTKEFPISEEYWEETPQWNGALYQFCFPLTTLTDCWDMNGFQCSDGSGGGDSEYCQYILTPETGPGALATHSVRFYCNRLPDSAQAELGDVCEPQSGVSCKSGFCAGDVISGYNCTQMCRNLWDCPAWEFVAVQKSMVVKSLCLPSRISELMDLDPKNDAFVPICKPSFISEKGAPAKDSLEPCSLETGSYQCPIFNGTPQICKQVVLSTDANSPAWNYYYCRAQQQSDFFKPLRLNGSSCDYDDQCDSGTCGFVQSDPKIQTYYANTSSALEDCPGPPDSNQESSQCSAGAFCAVIVDEQGNYLPQTKCVSQLSMVAFPKIIQSGYCTENCQFGTDGDGFCQGAQGLNQPGAVCIGQEVIPRPTDALTGKVFICKK